MYKRYHDRRTQPLPSFSVRDLVWLRWINIKSLRSTPKLDSKRLGPFHITEVVGESKLAFRLNLPPNLKIHSVFHIDLLDPYHANETPRRTQPPPPLEVVEGEEEYEVREILDSRILRGKLEYLVDWKGYSEEERTWESVENVSGAPDLVTAFNRKYLQRPASKDIPRRSSRS